MTRSDFTACLARLGEAAREAGIAEESFRKEAARRIEALRQERAFAFRRLNLLRAVGAAVEEAQDEEQALASGRAVFLRETGLHGVDDRQKAVIERFLPVISAVWLATGAGRQEAEDAVDADPGEDLAAFERWYEEERGRPFPTLMEREVAELPLVEV